MTLNRNQFFLLIALIFIMPFFVPRIIWLWGSRQTVGEMRFQGHGNLGSVLGISSYPVIRYLLGKDTIYFNGNVNMDLRPGQKVPVLYQVKNPADALVNSFPCIWMDAISLALLPALVLLVLFLTPDHMDTVIPRKSKIIVGKRPFVRILKDTHF